MYSPFKLNNESTELDIKDTTLDTMCIYASILLQRSRTSSTEVSSVTEYPVNDIEIKKLYLSQNSKILSRSSSSSMSKSIKKRSDLHNSAGILTIVQKVRFSDKITVRYFTDASFKYKDRNYIGL